MRINEKLKNNEYNKKNEGRVRRAWIKCDLWAAIRRGSLKSIFSSIGYILKMILGINSFGALQSYKKSRIRIDYRINSQGCQSLKTSAHRVFKNFMNKGKVVVCLVAEEGRTRALWGHKEDPVRLKLRRHLYQLDLFYNIFSFLKNFFSNKTFSFVANTKGAIYALFV